ncbi:hypothetical protein D3C84_1200440 [compost metagenome]
MQGVFVVAGDMEGLHQQATIVIQQAVALDNPAGQLPVFGQGLAESQQWHAKQFALDPGGRLAFAQYALFPGGEEFRMGGQERPEGGEE